MGIKEQHESLDELAALTDDRDRWQARAKQAEGRVITIGQELEQKHTYTRQMEREWAAREQQLNCQKQQIIDLQAQLEAAAHTPDRSAEVERLAAERDAAREEVRVLQVRVQQAEGDARNATAKMRHLERETAIWQTQAEDKTSLLLKEEGANNALQVVILTLFREVCSDE